MQKLILYTKPECCLCSDALDALERVRMRVPFELEVVDVSRDAELLARYGERVPVVLGDAGLTFEYTVDEEALEAGLIAAGAPA